MKTLIVFLFALFTIVVADTYYAIFNSPDGAKECYAVNSAYINKLSLNVKTAGPVLFMNMKPTDPCESVITEEITAVCKNQTVTHSGCLNN